MSVEAHGVSALLARLWTVFTHESLDVIVFGWEPPFFSFPPVFVLRLKFYF
jgi:hypothetical protein